METAMNSGVRQSFIAWTRRHRLWGRLAPIVPAGLFVLTWFAFSDPVVYWNMFVVAGLGWFFYSLLWLLLLAIQIARRAAGKAPLNRRPWLFLPAFGAVTILACWAGAPFWSGYLASRPAMDQAARDVADGKRSPKSVHWLGVYPIESTWTDHRSVVFWVDYTDQGPEDYSGTGFLYSPNRPDPTSFCKDQPVPHLSGHWYKIQVWDCGA
jgi:hypothetical protein